MPLTSILVCLVAVQRSLLVPREHLLELEASLMPVVTRLTAAMGRVLAMVPTEMFRVRIHVF